MNKTKKVILIFLLTIIILFIFTMPKFKIATKDEIYSESKEENEIQELKKQLGITGQDEIYSISKEFDNTKTIKIKPEVQYITAMAGVIQQKKPQYLEIKELETKLINQKGIWVSKNSRKEFLDVLKSITKGKYTINEQGYLVQQESNKMNKYDEKIKKILNGKNSISIDINSTCYILDEVTGEIVEYPFEDMDPYMPYEYFEDKNKMLYIITRNKHKKSNYQDIISEIIDNIKL